MLADTLARLQSDIESAEIAPDKRAELVKSLAALREEIAALEKTDAEQARSVASFAQLSTHEATRTQPRAELRDLSLTGLRRSVQNLEKSHPRLVEAIGSLASALSSLGV